MRHAALGIMLALTACSQEAEGPAAAGSDTATQIAIAAATDAENSPSEIAQSGTPMDQRVATIGLLNKRNNETRNFEMTPGDSERIGNVIIKLDACERTAAWEMPQETGAFVQVSVQERGSDDFAQVFSGWLFKNSPSLNVVEHPIYDVWVKDCAMSFPGE